MVALGCVAGASGGADAHPGTANHAYPRAVCFEQALLEVQVNIVDAQLEAEVEALDETMRTVASSERSEDALLVQMQAQLEGVEKTRRRAMALLKWAAEVEFAALLIDCDVLELPRIS
jgi:hypothetical protein